MSLQKNGKRDTNRKRTRLSPPPMHVTLALEAHDCLHSSHCPTESFVRVAGAAVSTKARAAVVFRASGMGARRAAPGAAIAMAATHDAIATNSSQRRTKHSQPNQQLRRKTKRNRRTYKERARTWRERERWQVSCSPNWVGLNPMPC